VHSCAVLCADPPEKPALTTIEVCCHASFPSSILSFSKVKSAAAAEVKEAKDVDDDKDNDHEGDNDDANGHNEATLEVRVHDEPSDNHSAVDVAASSTLHLPADDVNDTSHASGL